MRQIIFNICVCLTIYFLAYGCSEQKIVKPTQPNILWIIAEDLSPFMGAYGDSINIGHTPIIDNLASEGVLFTRAYTPAPVCSAARSALITGVMQTTTGTHNHRSSRYTNDSIVPEHLRILLPQGMKTIPELMKQAGYFTFNSGKDDYNFHYDRRALYDVGTKDDYKHGMNGWQGNFATNYMSVENYVWKDRPDKDQPWFGQVQIMGGKKDFSYVRSGEKLDSSDVKLPPYFPNISSQRLAWVQHYNANRGSDVMVEKILKQLKADGELKNTIIFFFSDHGSNSSLRHKQFCYEGGMHIPLIISGNHDLIKNGTKRSDLVSLLDVAVTTLSLGQANTPPYLDGKDLFDANYSANEFLIGARDRCDYSIDRIRTVVSKEYRYIKNYFPDRPMLQAGYRDNQAIVTDLKKLNKEGALTPYQEKHWFGTKPIEELYHLESDPDQIYNLASEPQFQKPLNEHRKFLESWILRTNDKGQYPEDANQLQATYELWKNRERFKKAKTNPEFLQFKNKQHQNEY